MSCAALSCPSRTTKGGDPELSFHRETSPVPLRSLPSSSMQSQNSYCNSQENSSQGSVYNEQCRSAMSLRSVGSNSSVSAANIVVALNNSYLNKYELRVIKGVCNSLMRSHQSRRTIGKRRNLKSILKYRTRQSSGESGVEESDSSSSSDDCKSPRSTFYKVNVPVTKTRPVLANCNNNMTHTSVSDIYEDRSENFKQNSLRNLLLGNNRTANHRSNNKQHFTLDRHINIHRKMTDNHMYSEINKKGPNMHTEKSKNVSENGESIISASHIMNYKVQNQSAVTLKERFTQSSFLLPSQRFGKPAAQSTTYEISNKLTKSSQPLVGVVCTETMNMPQTSINFERTHNRQETNNLCLTAIDTVNDNSMTDTLQDFSNISKSSFMTRKPLTQNLDIVDSNNVTKQGNKTNTNDHKDNGKEVENLKHSITKDSGCTKNKQTNVQSKAVKEKLSDNKVQKKSRNLGLIQSFWDIDFSDVDSNVDSRLRKRSRQKQSRKKVGDVKWKQDKTDLPDVNENECSTSKMKSPEEKRPKKAGLARTFWDTDLSDVDYYEDSPLKMKPQQEQKTTLKETTNSNAKQGKSAENIKTSTRSNRRQMKNKEDERNFENSTNVSTRQSVRIKQLKNKNNSDNLTLDSDDCNRPRESIRLKLKRQQANTKALNKK